MKKISFWITVIGLMVMTAGFVSCSKDDEGSLIGTWRTVEVNGEKYGEEADFEFTKDGKFLYEEDGNNFSDGSDTYTLKDNVIYFTYVPADEIIWGDQWKIVSLTKKNVVADVIFIKNPSDNVRVKLERIK